MPLGKALVTAVRL